MIKLFKNFRNDEDGAVTVDWVVLTAAVLALGFLVFNQVRDGADDLAGDIQTGLEGVTVNVGQ